MTSDQLRKLMEGPTADPKKLKAREVFLKTAHEIIENEGMKPTDDRVRLVLSGFYNGMRFTEGLPKKEKGA